MVSKAKIHPSAFVSESAEVGEGTKVWHNAQIREGAKVGRNCVIGKGVYIGKNVLIGDNVKMQNLATIYQGVTIEDKAFIGPHVVFTNDLRPRSFDNGWKVVKTLVKKGASIGANATIICGVVIGAYSMIGAASVVTKDVPSNTLVYGSPAVKKGFMCFCGNRLSEVVVEADKVVGKCGLCNKKIELNLDI